MPANAIVSYLWLLVDNFFFVLPHSAPLFTHTYSQHCEKGFPDMHESLGERGARHFILHEVLGGAVKLIWLLNSAAYNGLCLHFNQRDRPFPALSCAYSSHPFQPGQVGHNSRWWQVLVFFVQANHIGRGLCSEEKLLEDHYVVNFL